MKKLRRIDIIVIGTGVAALASNIVLLGLYDTRILGHHPFHPLEMFGFLQYAWPVIGAIAVFVYFAALRYIIRPTKIVLFVVLLMLAGGLSWCCWMVVMAAS